MKIVTATWRSKTLAITWLSEIHAGGDEIWHHRWSTKLCYRCLKAQMRVYVKLWLMFVHQLSEGFSVACEAQSTVAFANQWPQPLPRLAFRNFPSDQPFLYGVCPHHKCENKVLFSLILLRPSRHKPLWSISPDNCIQRQQCTVFKKKIRRT